MKADHCDGCLSKPDCIILNHGLNPDPCPCRFCMVKEVCDEACDEHVHSVSYSRDCC